MMVGGRSELSSDEGPPPAILIQVELKRKSLQEAQVDRDEHLKCRVLLALQMQLAASCQRQVRDA
jgi:hypothetical protein